MDERLALRVFFCCSVSVFFVLPSAEGRGQADDCISGFMSLDRMNKVLDIVNAPNDQQAIIPEINFTCNGTIRTWIIGGQWRNNGENNIELQIWRSGGSGLYNRVQSTVVTVATSNDIALGVYHLPSNLSFQAGDILGFYLPSDSRFRLRLAMHMEPLQTVYLRNGNPDTEFDTTASSSSRMQNVLVSVETGKFLVDISRMQNVLVSVETGKFLVDISRMQNVLVSVETDPPDCGSGFMSVETIVELGEVGRFTGYNRRQQITPAITFTCNGWITKWIIGALWNGGNMLFPELQIWRNDGNDTYRKINGTFISVETRNASLIYKYSNFSPIPFQAGDILGAFVPQGGLSKLKLRSEGNRGHLNYYIRTDVSAIESPYDSINLSGIVTRATYHPMVSVEISVSTTSAVQNQMPLTTTTSSSLDMTSSTITPPNIQASLTSSVSPGMTFLIQSSTTSASDAATATTVLTAQPDMTSSVSPGITYVGTDTGSQLSVGAGVGVGVGAAVVLLVVVGVLGFGLLITGDPPPSPSHGML